MYLQPVTTKTKRRAGKKFATRRLVRILYFTKLLDDLKIGKFCMIMVTFSAVNRISRGCGKIPSVAISDDACKEVGTEGKEWDCNCNMHECNAAPIDLLGAGLMLVAAVFYLLA